MTEHLDVRDQAA